MIRNTLVRKKPLAIFLDKASLYPDDLDFSALEEVADWQWFDNAKPETIQAHLNTAEILVANKVLLSRDVIDNCGQLKLICIAATGANNVDLKAARERNIAVCNVRAYATSSVAQHVFSLLLAINQKLFSHNKSVLNGDWSRSEFFCHLSEPMFELAGKTLGIIGYGELGRAVAEVAGGFGMKVQIAHSFNTASVADADEDRIDLKTLLSTSDVVSLHCPLTENNVHLIAEKEIASMKPGAILINTARGGLIDEQALLAALEDNRISAALDVLEEEPPASDNALAGYQGENLIVTPHIAWASRESRQRLVDEIVKNIVAFQQGSARNIL